MSARSYQQFCGVAHALDLVGERWALLVVRELLLGPKRHRDLAEGLPGIGSNVLSTRLRELLAAKLIRKYRAPPPSSALAYELTDYGRDLGPILLSLGRWGASSLGLRAPEQTLRATWLGFAMLTAFSPKEAGKLEANIEITMPSGTIALALRSGTLEVVEGFSRDAMARMEISEDGLLGLLFGGASLSASVRARTAKVSGDQKLLRRVLALCGGKRGQKAHRR